MAARTLSAIKIKKLYYDDVLTAAPTKAGLPAAVSASTEITNIHQGTYTYEETDPTIDNYKNELNGQTYRSNVSEPGEVSLSFVIGAYTFEDKAALQGGTSTVDSWIRGNGTEQRYKALYAITEDDICIVFPKANIIGSNSYTDNAIGLSVRAIPQEIDAAIKSEYWFDVKDVDFTPAPNPASLI